jgi:hypothetical protein
MNHHSAGSIARKDCEKERKRHYWLSNTVFYHESPIFFKKGLTDKKKSQHNRRANCQGNNIELNLAKISDALTLQLAFTANKTIQAVISSGWQHCTYCSNLVL